MEWLNHSRNLNIKHKMNNGREKRVGPYLLDGYDSNTEVAYEVFGCYFHGHSCIDPKNAEQHKLRFAKTQERLTYLQSQGYNTETIWECQFRQSVKVNKTMKDFIDQRYPSFYKQYSNTVSESHILDAVVNETLFGFVEVDIQVPDKWDQVKYKPETDLTPA